MRSPWSWRLNSANIASLSQGTGGFSPSLLFAASEQGAWYDPNDLSSMFQDSAGTTPAAIDQPVGKINDKSGRGNHLTQATAASKPILRRDYNVIGDEIITNNSFDTDTVWTKSGGWTISAGKANCTAGAVSQLYQAISARPAGTVRRVIITISNYTAGTLVLRVGTTSGPSISGNGTFVRDIVDTGYNFVNLYSGGTFAGSVDDVSVKEAVATDNYYLEFDGIDDFLSIASFAWSGHDAVTFCAGLVKTSDAAVGTVAEYSANTSSIAGSWGAFAPLNAGTANIAFRNRGTLGGTSTTATSTSTPAGTKYVVTGRGDISDDTVDLRLNTTDVATVTVDQGDGPYATNIALYVGRRAGSTLPFYGSLYGMVISGIRQSDSTVNQLTSWMNSRIGAY
jgi:hypothetical protein